MQSGTAFSGEYRQLDVHAIKPIATTLCDNFFVAISSSGGWS
jgi:hypothetical protein